MTDAKDGNVEHMQHVNLVTRTVCVYLFSALHPSMTLWEVHKFLTKAFI